jgi:hypothetical protein
MNEIATYIGLLGASDGTRIRGLPRDKLRAGTE